MQKQTLETLAQNLGRVDDTGSASQHIHAFRLRDPQLQLAVAKSLAGVLLGAPPGTEKLYSADFVLPLVLLTEDWAEDGPRYEDWQEWVNESCDGRRNWVPRGYSALNPLWPPLLFLVHSAETTKSTEGKGVPWSKLCAKNSPLVRKLVICTDDEEVIKRCDRVYDLEGPESSELLQRARAIGQRPTLLSRRVSAPADADGKDLSRLKHGQHAHQDYISRKLEDFQPRPWIFSQLLLKLGFAGDLSPSDGGSVGDSFGSSGDGPKLVLLTGQPGSGASFLFFFF